MGGEGDPHGPPSHLSVGRITRAVGLEGAVEVTVSSDAPGRFTAGARVLRWPDLTELRIRASRPRRGSVVVEFEGVSDRTEAERLKGAELVIPASEARPLEPDEYWPHDLVGCEVVTTGGERIGRVTDVLHSPANDVLVVRADGGEHLVPLVRQVVKEVDPPRRIVIDPIPGLLEP